MDLLRGAQAELLQTLERRGLTASQRDTDAEALKTLLRAIALTAEGRVFFGKGESKCFWTYDYPVSISPGTICLDATVEFSDVRQVTEDVIGPDYRVSYRMWSSWCQFPTGQED
jgi:hypothetical protein